MASAAAAALLFDPPIQSFKHRVLVLPKWIQTWAGCTWAGLGTVGPSYVTPSGGYGYGYAWISGEHSTDINAFFHELSHNLYLGRRNHWIRGLDVHSVCPLPLMKEVSTHLCVFCLMNPLQFDLSGHGNLFPVSRCQDPCDASTAMGPCCGIRCHNAAQAWQLGWMAPSPEAIVHNAILPPGKTLAFVIPAMTSSFLNQTGSMVVIYPDWMETFGSQWVIFISYR